MAVKIIAPKLGMSTEPLTIVEWKLKEGEKVTKGSVVLVVETEKIRHDVEAEASGFLHILKLLVYVFSKATLHPS